jgi:hypothetical protein
MACTCGGRGCVSAGSSRSQSLRLTSHPTDENRSSSSHTALASVSLSLLLPAALPGRLRGQHLNHDSRIDQLCAYVSNAVTCPHVSSMQKAGVLTLIEAYERCH